MLATFIVAGLLAYGTVFWFRIGVPIYARISVKKDKEGKPLCKTSFLEFSIIWIILCSVLMPMTIQALFMRRDDVVDYVVDFLSK